MAKRDNTMSGTRSIETQLALLQNDVSYLKTQLDHVDSKVSNSFVTKEELNSRLGVLEKIVYGLVALILIAVVGALVNSVIGS